MIAASTPVLAVAARPVLTVVPPSTDALTAVADERFKLPRAVLTGRSLSALPVALAVVALAACDPVARTGSGQPLSPSHFTRIESVERTTFLTLQSAYPASDYQSNFNGWQ